MIRKIATIAALGFGLSAGAASAATVYAQEVTAFSGDKVTSCSLSQDLGGTANRSNICNALGAEDHPGGNSEIGFLSAGNYDALKFTFGGPFTGPLDFFEITFGNANGPNPNWQESLGLVFLIAGQSGASFGSVTPAFDGTVTNNDGSPVGTSTWKVTFDLTGGPFEELWVFDTSTGGPAAGGGFDIDAIRAVSVSPIPLPAAGFLLIAGLGGLALMRRRG